MSDLQRDYDRYRAQAPARPQAPVAPRQPAPAPKRRKTNPNLRSALKRPTVDTTPPGVAATPAAAAAAPADEKPPDQTLDLGSAVLEQVLEDPLRSRVATLDLGSGASRRGRSASRVRPTTRRPPAPPRPDGGGGPSSAPTTPNMPATGNATGEAAAPLPDAATAVSASTVAWHPTRESSDAVPIVNADTVSLGAPAAAEEPPAAELASPLDVGRSLEVDRGVAALEPLPEVTDVAEVIVEPEPVAQAPAPVVDPNATRAWKQKEDSGWGDLEDDAPLPSDPETNPSTRNWDGVGSTFDDHLASEDPDHALSEEERGALAAAPGTLRGAPGAATGSTTRPGGAVAAAAADRAALGASPTTGPMRENIRRGTTTYVDAARSGFTRGGGGGSRAGLWVSVGIGIALGLIALGVYIWVNQGAG